ncbi:MAG TPA: Crp/Fnr family transcriptional regulator [Anaerolineales bacterium]|nr:Crp/Fnr family transcriptional regulator [Anaerolineales bacterium]HNA87944.1 Crp/Fnr family transcriptional regulator [Anaerolineales bacterium]
MIETAKFKEIAGNLPFLEGADSAFITEFQKASFLAHIPAGRDVFLEGDRIEAIAILISGVVRVYKIGETGREITLYRFGNGSSCILTANAILNQTTFPAIATVEQDAEAIMIPAATFRDWVNRYETWRSFIFELLSQRLSTVMAVVDEVVFHRMDRRVATLLLERGKIHNPVRITHQEIASELGSSREVISRLLEDFISNGAIRSGRGTIEILDFEELKSRSQL